MYKENAVGGTTIGKGAVVGAGAVVSGNVPPYAIVVGNPAKVIRYRFSQEIIDKLLNIAWWNWDSNIVVARREDFSLTIEKFVEGQFLK